MTKPSHRRFVIASITLLSLLIGVSSFAQNAGDSGAHFRDLAASNRGLAADYRKRAQSWREMAQKARARQSDSNSAAMKQILADQIAQDEQEAAQATAEADRLEQKAREFDQKAREASGNREVGGTVLPPPSGPPELTHPNKVHGPTLPLGGSVANGGAEPASSSMPSTANAPLGVGPPLSPANPSGQSGDEPKQSGLGAPNPSSEATPGCDEAKDKEPVKLEELDGGWIDSATGERAEIKVSSITDISLRGRHKWTGDFGLKGGGLKLSRDQEPSEMGTAPEWAQQAVHKKIKWELELEARRECGQPVLKGKWYAGQFQWRTQFDHWNGSGQNSIIETSRGTPTEVKFAKARCDISLDSMPAEPFDLKLESHPGIMVVPKRDFPWPADSLDSYQPFFVEVRLSYDDAARQGKSLPIKIEVPATGRSKEIVLNGVPHRGPTVYFSDAPIIFNRPFDIKGPSDLIESPWDSENLESLKLKNGDLVKVSYNDVSTTFRFFDSWVQQEIARNEDGFTDLKAVYEQRLATSHDAREVKEIQTRLHMISNARHLINDYHPSASDDQLTDLDRCFIGNEYQRLLRQGPPGPDDRDEQARKNWASGPSDSKRFGIQFVNAAESDAVASGILERKKHIRENIVQIPLGFAMAEYHIMTQLSGANQMWTVVYGTDEDGNPVDLTGRIFAGIGAASGALFSVASSKYLTDLSPSAKARAKSGRGGQVDDEPVEAHYKLHPDTPESVKEFIERGPSSVGDVREPDIIEARKGYGPNVVFRTPDPTRPAVLQVADWNCFVEVARAHILEGTGRLVPEAVLRSAAAKEGHIAARGGMTPDGYVFLIGEEGGVGSTLTGGVKKLKQLVDAGYFVSVRVYL